ncbi:MAG: hypothetical protein JXB88_22075 [Spirochaetales bacterium]|nr:hypothetical protein [Spirochaetales bacterium]
MEKSGKIENTVYQHSIDINDLIIKKESIQTALGYKAGSAPDYVIKEIDHAFSEFNSINDIRGGFRIVYENPLSLKENGFYLSDVFFHTGAIIASNLTESDCVAFFLVTAGEVISKKVKEYNQSHNYMRAYIYDTVGSEIAECACDFIQSMIEKKVKTSGFSITNRYSPGYCGWDVREQHKLFSFFPDNFCHITLTKSALMIPIKSVSGIIGFGKKAVKRNYGCALCTMTSCYKRRKSG